MFDINQDLDYFTKEEFACQHTGENKIKDTFLLKLDLLRARCGFPFVITSGYRSPEHPIESRKEKAGTHAQGIAADADLTPGEENLPKIDSNASDNNKHVILKVKNFFFISM